LAAMSPENLKIAVFVPDLGIVKLSCDMKPVEFPAVAVYSLRSDTKNGVVGEVLSLDFVPKSFLLNP